MKFAIHILQTDLLIHREKLRKSLEDTDTEEHKVNDLLAAINVLMEAESKTPLTDR